MGKTYAEAVFKKYANTEVEVYIGQPSGRQLYAEYELDKYTIVRGLLKEAVGDMIVISVQITLDENEYITKDVCINGYSVHCISPVIQNVHHENIFVKLLTRSHKIPKSSNL